MKNTELPFGQSVPEWLPDVAFALRVPLAVCAALGCCLAIGVHLAAVSGRDIGSAHPGIWLLHYGVLPVLVLYVAVAALMAHPRQRFRDLVAHIPWISRLSVLLAFLYAAANLLMFIPASAMGDPIQTDGKFYFNQHGVMREVTESQFHSAESMRVRGFSGTWAFLYFVPAISLLTWRRNSLDSGNPRK